MKFGSLLVKMPDGSELEFPVNKPQVLIGRTPDNDLVISHATISRRHARIQFEPDQVMIEDLGSTNGTFLNSRKLDALHPVSISTHHDIFLGEAVVQFIASEQFENEKVKMDVSFETPANDPKPDFIADQSVALSMEGPFEPVNPGSSSNARITLQNISSSNQEYLIRVSGLPSNWFRLSSDRLMVKAGESEEITLYLHPPRLPEVNPGSHQLKVTIYSSDYGRGPSIHAILDIYPYTNFNLCLEPLKGYGDFTLIADNQSNIPLNYRFNGYDVEKNLSFEFHQSSVHLEAGQKARIPLSVSSQSKALFGHEELKTFVVIGDPTTDDIGETITEGHMVVRPTISIWSVPVPLILLAVLILIGTVTFNSICQNNSSALPICPPIPPSIHYFNAEPLVVHLGETVLIKWDISHADRVDLIAPALDLHVQVPQSGSQLFFLAQSTSFTIQAVNRTEIEDKSILINVIGAPPSLQSFSADPGAFVSGQIKNLILNWTVLDAENVIIEGMSDKLLPSEGTLEIPAPDVDTVYTLIAENEVGTLIQEFTVYVISPGCVVSTTPIGKFVGLYAGPAKSHPLIIELESDMIVEPFGRIATGDWLLVRSTDAEGWLPAEFVTCNVGVHIFPTLQYEEIPTPYPGNLAP